MQISHVLHKLCLARRHQTKALLMGLLAWGYGSAWAQNASINVQGTITGGACSISTTPVDLGAHDASEFSGIGKWTDWVDVPITSQGCNTDIVTLHMGFDGTADTDNNSLFAIQPNGAKGIGIQLQTEDGRATVIPNSTTDLVDWTPVTTGGTYPMRARYVQTRKDVTPGAADSTVTVMLSYN